MYHQPQIGTREHRKTCLRQLPTASKLPVSSANVTCVSYLALVFTSPAQQAHPSFAPASPFGPLKLTLSVPAPSADCAAPAAPGPLAFFICVSGMAFAIAVKTSCTLCPDFALVSKNNKPSSSAYSRPSFVLTFRGSASAAASSAGASLPSASPSVSVDAFGLSPADDDDDEDSVDDDRSNLFPTNAMTIPGFACRCNSATQCLAFTRLVGFVIS